MYGAMGSAYRSSSPVLLLDYYYRSRGRRSLGSSPPSPSPGFPSRATRGLLQQQQAGALGASDYFVHLKSGGKVDKMDKFFVPKKDNGKSVAVTSLRSWTRRA